MEADNIEIAYQNKDISSKAIAEHFKGETFEAFGVRGLPVIEDVLPTNLPVVMANELRIDNLFKLRDGSFAIIDYESGYSEGSKLKYLNYIARVEQRLYNNYRKPVPLRVIVIYTADVERGSTDPIFNAGCLQFEIIEAFLIEFDPEDIYGRISGKIKAGEELSDRELMELIIYPLTYIGDEAKRDAIARTIDLIALIKDDERKFFVAKFVLAFTDKVITLDDAERIRRILMMTKVEQIMYNEFKKKANIDMEEVRREERKQVIKEEKEKADKEKYDAIENLVKNGVDFDIINSSFTLSESEKQKVKDMYLQEA